MDSKFSDFPKAQSIGVTDFFPIVKDGDNQTITAGLLFLNLPNLGNKGITKNAVVVASGASVPLTGTVVVLEPSEAPYSLVDGSNGQTIIIVGAGDLTIHPQSFGNQVIGMNAASTITLMFVSALGQWVCLSNINCEFTLI